MPSAGRFGALTLLAALGACGGSDVQTPSEADRVQLVEMSPRPRALNVAVNAPIVLRFDRAVRPETVEPGRTLHVFGRWSGTARGRVDLADGGRTVVFTPERPFSAGELVMVIVSRDVAGVDGTAFGPTGFSSQFWVRAAAGGTAFLEVQRLNTRREGGPLARAYGGIASDLDRDGWPDLAIVNEDASDLSVFLNRRDGTFTALAARPPLGRRASPSEPADFDHDGDVDLAVANIGDGTVSILLGGGDGTFAPAQVLAVGDTPRGLAVLDVDGDGDVDVATANYRSDDVAILLNDGRGRFSAGPRIDTGLRGEWALGAADMDEDGLLDLVAGAQDSARVAVLKNEGDGRFRPLGTQAAGGGPWMLATGDLDGDGHEDVAVVNGRSNTAAILHGDGRGGLTAPLVHPIDPFGLASDLGDLDGDGDLDFMTSSYSGDWRLFENQGGTFRAGREIAPRLAASCALMFDADRDGDLDLALIDEEADDVIVVRNGPGP